MKENKKSLKQRAIIGTIKALHLEKLVNHEHAILHPNRISGAGVILCAASLVGTVVSTYFPESVALQALNPSLFLAGGLCDFVDGPIANEYGLRTIEGSFVDPDCDKAKDIPMLAFLSATTGNPVIISESLVNIVGDLHSRNLRSIELKKSGSEETQLQQNYRAIMKPWTCTKDEQEVSKTRANWFGKIKTASRAVLGFMYVSAHSRSYDLLDYSNKENLGRLVDFIEGYVNSPQVIEALDHLKVGFEQSNIDSIKGFIYDHSLETYTALLTLATISMGISLYKKEKEKIHKLPEKIDHLTTKIYSRLPAYLQGVYF